MTAFDGTIRSLIASYKADKISPYRKLRHRTKENYDSLLRRIDKDHGSVVLASIKYRTFLEWHSDWSPNGERIPMAHSLMGMVRTIVGFGVVFLEDRECER